MEKMDKKMVWSIGIVAVVIIIIVVVMMQNQKSKNAAQPAQTETPAASIPTGVGTPAKLSYTEAIAKYGTNRIQFDSTCQAHPNTVTYKAGTAVMFDNRATIAHTISFNGTKYVIAADNYTVVSMTAAKYPTTVLVDCDKSQNVATVLIQK